MFNGMQGGLPPAAARGLAVGGNGDGGLGYAVDHGHHDQVIGAAKGRFGTRSFGKERAARLSLFLYASSKALLDIEENCVRGQIIFS